VFFSEFIGRRKFTGLALYGWIFGPSSDCDELYTSDGIPSEINGWKGQNFPGYRNAEMDEVCKAAAREVDESRRNQLLRQSAHIFSRDLPALSLHVRLAIAAVRTGLENFTPTQVPPLTWNAHAWYWK
jgi:peptide/nickel transport system substrate-binding protein